MKPGTEKNEQQQKTDSGKQGDNASGQNTGKLDPSKSGQEEKPSREAETEQKSKDVQRQAALKQDPTSKIDNDSVQKQEGGGEEKKHWDDEPEKEEPDQDKEPRTKIHTTRPDEAP